MKVLPVDDDLLYRIAWAGHVLDGYGDQDVVKAKCELADAVLRLAESSLGRPRAPIPFLVRARVWARDQFRCVKCGSDDRLTLDHVVPHSRGGTDEEENLQTLCGSCNSRKGARDDE